MNHSQDWVISGMSGRFPGAENVDIFWENLIQGKDMVSGLCGIIKVLVSRRAGVFPPNLHFKTPNPECHALIEGRIQIVTKATTFKGSLVGINCLGIGGTLAHIILEFDLQRELASIINNSDNSRITTDMQGWRSGICFTSAAIPTLLPASGRTNEAVDYFLNEAMKNSHNKDFVGLLQNIVRSVVPRHEFAGYALIKPSGEFEIISQKQQETLVSTWTYDI
ncbi:unnamed protein product [Allacma fusca]|uniref:Polyketide synthase n=1 Tax=Allacma fusca TaxID=39272 RepID=A0A8J2L115_9HEXA|nr:unnamed protein product [Allacma fusca]